MNLDTSNWKTFLIEELFTFSRGKTLSLQDKELYNGEIPCINGSAENNGVLCGLSSSIEETGFKIQSSPALSLSRVGASGMTFFQPKDFYIADNAFALQLKTIQSSYCYLFLSTVLNMEVKKYSYGRTISIEKYLKTKIKLPATTNGFPDWNFMESFIKSLHYKPIKTNIKKESIKTEIQKWRKFLFSEIFTIHNGKGITKEEVEEFPGDFAAVQSGEINNGVLGFIDKNYCREMNYIFTEEPCLTVARTGTAGFVAFQKNGCVAGDSAKILLLKNKGFSNTYVYIFLATILNANRYKFSYGRKVTEEKYNDLVLRLPVDSDGNPDYHFMENYIKSLPYSDRI